MSKTNTATKHVADQEFPMTGMCVTFEAFQSLIDTLESSSSLSTYKKFTLNKAPAALKVMSQIQKVLIGDVEYWGNKAFDHFSKAKETEAQLHQDKTDMRELFSAADLKTKAVKEEIEAFDAEAFNTVNDIHKLETECLTKASQSLEVANYVASKIEKVAEDIGHSGIFYIKELEQAKLDPSNLIHLAKELGIKGTAFLKWKQEAITNHELKVEYMENIEPAIGAADSTFYKAVLFSRRSPEFSIEYMEQDRIKAAAKNAVSFKADKAPAYEAFIEKALFVEQAILDVLVNAYEEKLDCTDATR